MATESARRVTARHVKVPDTHGLFQPFAVKWKSGVPFFEPEKIFQIPYRMPATGGETSNALVGGFVAGDRAAAAPQPEQATGSADKEDDQGYRTVAEALTLTRNEIESLTQLSPWLGDSPPRARRFVNVYRVAK